MLYLNKAEVNNKFSARKGIFILGLSLEINYCNKLGLSLLLVAIFEPTLNTHKTKKVSKHE